MAPSALPRILADLTFLFDLTEGMSAVDPRDSECITCTGSSLSSLERTLRNYCPGVALEHVLWLIVETSRYGPMSRFHKDRNVSFQIHNGRLHANPKLPDFLANKSQTILEELSISRLLNHSTPTEFVSDPSPLLSLNIYFHQTLHQRWQTKVLGTFKDLPTFLGEDLSHRTLHAFVHKLHQREIQNEGFVFLEQHKDGTCSFRIPRAFHDICPRRLGITLQTMGLLPTTSPLPKPRRYSSTPVSDLIL